MMHKKILSVAEIPSRIQKGDRIHIINLGCARNTVDSQMILGSLKTKGHPIVDLKHADVVIINTCAFIEEAKRESLDVILEAIDLKKEGKIKKVIVAGCLSERYGKDLIPELKEVDTFAGVAALPRDKVAPQVSLTPRHFAYVKICESCYNQCSFCAIPLIKGRFVSRRIETVVEEIRQLEKRGVQEINLIGQDITAYGIDLYREKSLAKLLKMILQATSAIPWIRLLYTYPKHVTDELLDVIAAEERICKYIDVPLQHVSDRILKAMNRGMTCSQTRALITKIRQRIPGVAVRSSFIVGFPGETEKEFRELLAFIREAEFERLGAFVYSREEGTKAYRFRGHIPSEIKEDRYKRLMSEQQSISTRVQMKFLGRTLKVLVDERLKTGDNIYVGRSEFDAPEVDGNVYIHSHRRLTPGAFVLARVKQTQEYDLVADA